MGGLFRLVPEILKLRERAGERAHELAMFEKQLEADKLRATSEIDRINAQAAANIGHDEITAIIEATRAQAQPSGVKWIDGLSSLMRPLITFWWVIVLYSVALGARFWALVREGATNTEAIIALWGADERAIVASIVAFWFCDRALRRGLLK
ncbi:MAG TPA: hypothetical protein VJ001_02200 [Rhodocyclaceae bacterium]|nr:hypothetical protein [Rhodocyclaceae bacterium]